MAVAVAAAVTYALYVRLMVNPKRYEGSHRKQGVLVLAAIFTVMISLLLMNAGRMSLAEDSLAAWRPASRLIGGLFADLNSTTQRSIVEASYLSLPRSLSSFCQRPKFDAQAPDYGIARQP